MKELFYTAKTIDKKAKEFLGELLPYRKLHSRKLSMQHAVLLVMDMQPFFLDSTSHAFIPSAVATIPTIQKLQDHFLQRQRPLILTVHAVSDDPDNNMSKWWGHRFDEVVPAPLVIDPLVKQGSNVHLITKTQYDAFYRTDLEKILRQQQIQQVVITGVMTHICCDTTARSAFMRGFDVFMVIDGTSSYNEAFHLGALRNLAHACAAPILAEEIIYA